MITGRFDFYFFVYGFVTQYVETTAPLVPCQKVRKISAESSTDCGLTYSVDKLCSFKIDFQLTADYALARLTAASSIVSEIAVRETSVQVTYLPS